MITFCSTLGTTELSFMISEMKVIPSKKAMESFHVTHCDILH